MMIGTVEGRVGSPVTLKGYAQDYGVPIAAIQFSCDEGCTWSSYALEKIDPDCNINWSFSFTPEKSGDYKVLIRALSSDERTTPEPAIATITVT